MLEKLFFAIIAGTLFFDVSYGVELITKKGGAWEDFSVWREITYSPTVEKEVNYFPNNKSHTVSVEKDVSVSGTYTVGRIMTGFSSGTNTLAITQGNKIIIDTPATAFSLRGGASNPANNLIIDGDILVSNISAPSTGVCGFTFTDNVTAITAAKYLRIKGDFSTTEQIEIKGVSASKSFLFFDGNANALYNDIYAKVNLSKASVEFGLGSEANFANFIAGTDTSVTVNGALNVHGINGQNFDSMKFQGNVLVGESGCLSIAGSYGNLYLSNGANMVVNSPEGSLIVPRYLRMDGNSKLVFNTSNPLVKSVDTTQKQTALWFWGGNQTVVFNADNSIGGLCFGTNTQLTIELGQNCSLLEIDKLSVQLDSNTGFLTSTNSLTFKNFKNNTVKVNSVRDETELKRIFAEGFKDGAFYISANGFLNGFPIPTLVFSGFSDPTKITYIAPNSMTLNENGKVDVNSNSSNWQAGIKTMRLEPDTEYTVTITYRIDPSSTGYMLAYVRNQVNYDPSTDYISHSLRDKSETEYFTTSFTFITDKNASKYSICIDVNGAISGELANIVVEKSPMYDLYKANETSDYIGTIENIPTGASEFDVIRPTDDGLVVNAADYGVLEGSPNIATNLNSAIVACNNLGARKLILPKGNYYIKENKRINFNNLKNFIFDAQGSTFIFNKNLKATSGNTGNFQIKGCSNIHLKNLNVDWDWDTNPLASIVKVVGVGNGYIDILFTEYDVFPNKENVRVATFSSYDPITQSVGIEGGMTRSLEMYVGKNIPQTSWLSDNTLRVYTSTNGFASGQLYRLQHSYYEMGNISMDSNQHITLENLNIYSCSGHALVMGGTQQYTYLKNVNIVRPPNPYRRAITCTADHLHCASSRGYIKLENCEFSLGADDCINFHDCTAFAYKQSDYTLRTVNTRQRNWYKVGSVVELRNGDYSPTGYTGTITSVSAQTGNDGVEYDIITFSTVLPELVKDGFVLFNKNYDTRNIIIRDSYFHDNRARGILILARDVTIENCRFFHNEMGALKFETGYTFDLWSEGYGVDNVVVRNCIFESVNPGEAKSKDGFARDIYIGVYLRQDPSVEQTLYPILKNILIENNSFYDSYGLIGWIASAGNLIIRNNTFVNETARNNPLDYRASFRVSSSSDVKIINNTYINSEFVSNAGVYVAPTTTSNVLIAGNKTIPKPNVSAVQEPIDLMLSLKPEEIASGSISFKADSFYRTSYQWYKTSSLENGENDISIIGQNTDTLDISKTNITQTSYFYCIARDSTSSIKSRVATVAINRYIPIESQSQKNVRLFEDFEWKFSSTYDVSEWILSGNIPSGVVFNPETSILKGSSIEMGTFDFFVEAKLLNGISSSPIAYRLIVENSQEYETWLDENFTAQEKSNDSIVGDLVSLAGDGITNLQKMAMNLNPKEIASQKEAGLIPVEDSNFDIAFEFRKSKKINPKEIVFNIEESDTMLDWSIVKNAQFTTVKTYATYEIVRVGMMLENKQQAKFYRLHIRRNK